MKHCAMNNKVGEIDYMNSMVFKRADYRLDALLADIETGELGLPDLQRPFVWQNIKVRDLLDSMLRGYPIGYLMLWDAPDDINREKQIGVEQHTIKAPKQMIIDGQQRLTSLYAVMYGKEVLDSRFQKKTVSIAFNPLKREFEVTSAAHRKSAEWISDVSVVFKNTSGSYRFIGNFIDKLSEYREQIDNPLSSEEKDQIADNIQVLLSLKDYTVPTLIISNKTDEEAVADIFVRVNSKGKSLNENDFILTLISVHDESVRRKIEKFCSDALIPVKSGTSYNQLFSPKASHIIRAVMAYGFKRARLRYAYMVLEGKDLSTGLYDSTRREKMFDQLRSKLDIVLNLSNWHDFMKCLVTAGYVSSSLIAADNAIVYTYVMYLIGLCDFKLDRIELRKLIALWFYMSTVTMRYSISTESTVQSDLNDIEKLATAAEFRNYIMQRIEETFTDDFFAIQLPANMETSASISPAWNAYCAAQNILGTDAMFSSVPLKVLLSPGSGGNKSSVDKHHLFPRAYLPTIGHTSRQEINQIANFAYIEWPQNIAISDEAPSVYWPEITSSMNTDAIRRTCDENALPEGWEYMDYPEFLAARRQLMAEIVKCGYMALLAL